MKRKDRVNLEWGVKRERKFHMFPCNGEPENTLERVSQTIIKVIAFLPVYTAIVVTLMLYILLFGVPLVKGV